MRNVAGGLAVMLLTLGTERALSAQAGAVAPPDTSKIVRESVRKELERRDVELTRAGEDSIVSVLRHAQLRQSQAGQRTLQIREEADLVLATAQVARRQARGSGDEPMVDENTVAQAIERRCKRRYPKPSYCPN